MDGPKLTEERLRNHLDSNQPAREGMCLALLPLLGPYTRERPRRPKGGPDGARDIECLYEGATPVWGAVGFKNGGGRDDPSREEIDRKFRADITAALEENPSLTGFIFFTNVDLTPGRCEGLIRHAQERGIRHVEIFDFERLRNALDSSEGLIARVQWLGIPMNETEQLALVGKFGTQLQNAVTARFDRVERTLTQMERFLDFQRPLLRLDTFVGLNAPVTSSALGNAAVYLRLFGVHDIHKSISCLVANCPQATNADDALVAEAYVWNSDDMSKVLHVLQSRSPDRRVLAHFAELSFTTGGTRVALSDLTVVKVEAACTQGFYDKIVRISVDLNGYELLSVKPDGMAGAVKIEWPPTMVWNPTQCTWVSLVRQKRINVIEKPLQRSARHAPLTFLTAR